MTIERKCQVGRIFTRDEYVSREGYQQDEWPMYAELTNGRMYGVDFVVSGTGVPPSVAKFVRNNPELAAAVDDDDGGLRVDEHMATSVRGRRCVHGELEAAFASLVSDAFVVAGVSDGRLRGSLHARSRVLSARLLLRDVCARHALLRLKGHLAGQL